MILVTGATGHLGIVLIKKLIEKYQEKIKVLTLPDDDLEVLKDFDLEIITGDICDQSTLKTAFQDIDTVYHLAGKISIKDYDPTLKRINYIGTKNIIKFCFDYNIKRLIYISTVHVFDPDSTNTVTEKTSIIPEKLRGEYSRTKALATLEVKKAAQKGLNAVIIYPSGIIGPYDYRLSAVSRMIIDHFSGKLFCSVQGSYDFVDVRDLAEGIVKVATKGKKGEGYILSGIDISIDDIFKIIDNIKKPLFKTLKLPLWMAKIGVPFSYSYNKMIGCENILTRYALYTLNSDITFSNLKAKKELNFKTRPIEKTIEDTVIWLKDQGIL